MAPELLSSWLENLAGGLRFLLESVSVLCVALGFLLSLGQALRPRSRRPPPGLRFNSLRLQFGSWLSLALEFQLAADIVATTTAPSTQNLIQLAVVAVIRTFLNVFLSREVEEEEKRAEAERHRTLPPPP
ncbi:MAG: DUF1622 domain-containing protein [Synechococcus sp.]|nr:DUF1622 domain-containing protein [Synechococcus sp.]